MNPSADSPTPHQSAASETASALVAETCQWFHREFQRTPRWIGVAPGRVNLIGEHTDYNQGLAMPLAIDRYVAVAADLAPEGTGHWDCYSSQVASHQVLEMDWNPRSREDWLAYVRGVAAQFAKLGCSIPPLQLVVHSNLPMGAGLSSSAALELALAQLLQNLLGTSLSPMELAQLGQRAEHEFAHMPCGLMDQWCVACAIPDHLLELNFRSLTSTPVPWTATDLAFLVINSGVKHEHTESGYAERRYECDRAMTLLGVDTLADLDPSRLSEYQARLPEPLHRRVKHVITENQRVVACAEAIRRQAWSTLGNLLYASHRSLRDDFEVSCPELDGLVSFAGDLGESGGVYGARMTGGGFGGSTINLVARIAIPFISDRIQEQCLRHFGQPVDILEVQPVQGARAWKMPPTRHSDSGSL